jgi:hypothetical protein
MKTRHLNVNKNLYFIRLNTDAQFFFIKNLFLIHLAKDNGTSHTGRYHIDIIYAVFINGLL